MFFRQLFDEASSCFTYLLADAISREALLIDPVLSNIDTYLTLLNAEKLTLKYTLETHLHADHITAGGKLKQLTGSQTVVSRTCGAPMADIKPIHGDQIELGRYVMNVIATPGHTLGSLSYLCEGRVFTGDALLINGCGRTDFQGGDAGQLYDSITQQLFTLADETLVYPGHNYQGRRVSCIGQEKAINPRLANKTRDEFIDIMNNLHLPKPKLMDVAVPANLKCGVDEAEIPHG